MDYHNGRHYSIWCKSNDVKEVMHHDRKDEILRLWDNLSQSSSLIYQGQKTGKTGHRLPIFFQIFLHALKAPQDGAAHRAAMYALGPAYFGIAFAVNDTSFHTVSLHLG